MKAILSVIFLTLLIFATLYPQISAAQDYTQWSLPEGVKARIGKGFIYDMQYAPESPLLAVATSVGIWLYDTETYQELALLTRHTRGVEKIAFSPDGKTLASIERLKGVVLWDVTTRKEKKILTT